MALTKEEKDQIKQEFKRHETDTGSVEVQVALLTKQVNALTEHLKIFKKDHNSRRSLLIKVGHRRRLLDYLKKTNFDRYVDLISKLNLRK